MAYPFDAQYTLTDTVLWTNPRKGPRAAVSTPYRLSGRSTVFIARTNTYDPVPTSLVPTSPAAEGSNPQYLYSSVRLQPLSEPSGDGGTPSASLSTPLCTFRRHQPIDCVVRLMATAPYPIAITDVCVVPEALRGVALIQQPRTSDGEEILEEGEEFEHAFTLSGAQLGDRIPSGTVAVTARRLPNGAALTFSIPLPAITVGDVPLSIAVECDTVAVVGEPLPLTLRVRNASRQPQAISARASDSRSFFWAGRASFTADILPLRESEFQYCLIPIQTGTVSLPPIEIHDVATGAPVLQAAEKLSVFVYPKNHPSFPAA